MYFSTKVRIVYWVMDHNSPNKKPVNGIQQISSPPHTGDESVLELTREQIRQQIMSFRPPPLFSPSEAGSKNPTFRDVMIDTDRSVTVKPYSQTDQFQCTGCNGDDCDRRHCWDKYQMDYMGRDSFDNILTRLNRSLSSDVGHPH